METRKSYIDSDGEALEADEQWFREAKRGRPSVLNPKKSVTIRLDTEVIAYFKGEDEKGWQTRVNEALRKVAGV